MNISDVAKKTGLTSRAIRFYEERGLVTPSLRDENGHRTYSQQYLDELTLLRQARQVEFSLEECRELVVLSDDPSRYSADVKKRTLEKVADIENHTRELQNICAHLLTLAESCPGDDSAECPIVDSLSDCCHRKAQAQRAADLICSVALSTTITSTLLPAAGPSSVITGQELSPTRTWSRPFTNGASSVRRRSTSCCPRWLS